MTCAQVRELAPELALGIVTGPERSEALAHLEHCAPCRDAVGDLVETADALVLALPEAEPPHGFEARTLARITPRRNRRGWWSWRTATAAAALVAASVMASVGLVRIIDTADTPSTPTAAVRSAPMTGAGDRPAGHVYSATASGRPWLLIAVEYAVPTGRYTIDVLDAQGRRVHAGTVSVDDGRGTWGGAVPGVDSVHRVELVDATGQAVCEAQLLASA